MTSGVETSVRDGETFILMSDRDYGLFIFMHPQSAEDSHSAKQGRPDGPALLGSRGVCRGGVAGQETR